MLIIIITKWVHITSDSQSDVLGMIGQFDHKHSGARHYGLGYFKLDLQGALLSGLPQQAIYILHWLMGDVPPHDWQHSISFLYNS